jgi:tetratricopeptide (TPR) repeat protein
MNRGNDFYDRAIRYHSKAIRLNPNNPNAYNLRGDAYHDKKEYGKAISDLNEAIRLDPKFALAYVNRGNNTKAKENVKRRKPITPRRTSLKKPDINRNRICAGNPHPDAGHPTGRASQCLAIR